MREPVPQRMMVNGLIYILSRPNMDAEIVRYLEVRIKRAPIQDFDDYFVGEMSTDGFRHLRRIFSDNMTGYNWITVIMLMILRGHTSLLTAIIHEYPDILEHISVDNLCEFFHRTDIAPKADVLQTLCILKPELEIYDQNLFVTIRRIIQDNSPLLISSFDT